MKITAPLEELAAVLLEGSLATKADPVIGSGLAGYGIITLKAGKLSIQASGPMMTTKAFITVDDDDSEDGQCVVSLDKMSASIRHFPKKQPVTLQHFPGEPGNSGYLKVRSGKNSVKLPCAHPRVFPEFEEPEGSSVFSLDPEIVAKTAKLVSFAALKQDADNVRSNVCLAARDGKLSARAVNGVECCMCELGTFECEDGNVFLPIKIVPHLSKFLHDGEDAEFVDAGSRAIVRQRDRMICFAKPVEAEAKFPEFSKLLALPHEAKIGISREKLISMIGTVLQVHPEECLIAVGEGEIRIEAVNPVDGTEFKGVAPYSCDEIVARNAGIHPGLMGCFLKACKTDSIFFEFSEHLNERGWPRHIKATDGEKMTYFVRTLAAMTSMPGRED